MEAPEAAKKLCFDGVHFNNSKLALALKWSGLIFKASMSWALA